MTTKRFNIILYIVVWAVVVIIGIAVFAAVMLIFPEVAAYVM